MAESESSQSGAGPLSRIGFSAPGMALIVAMASVLLGTFRFQLARPGASVSTRESNPDLLSLEEKSLQSLNRGCFAPVSQQPILGALAALVGGSGLITLLQDVVSR
jgi:hypothetical protein